MKKSQVRTKAHKGHPASAAHLKDIMTPQLIKGKKWDPAEYEFWKSDIITLRYYDYRSTIMCGTLIEFDRYDILITSKSSFVIVPSSTGALKLNKGHPNNPLRKSEYRLVGFRKFIRSVYGAIPNQIMIGHAVDTEIGRGVSFSFSSSPTAVVVV